MLFRRRTSRPHPHSRLGARLLLIALLPAAFLAAQAPAAASAQNAGIVRDSQRRQNLQRQVDAWAERHARAAFAAVVEDVRNLGVAIIEPATVLPPELGGPRAGAVLRVRVEISAQGYAYDSFGYRHDGFGHRGFRRFANCRIHQTLMMRADGSGRPAALVEGQRITAPVACATGYY